MFLTGEQTLFSYISHNLFSIFSISFFLTFSFLLIFLGFLGFFFFNKNIISFLISNEIFLLGIIFMQCFSGLFFCAIEPYIFALILLVIAAAETAVILVIFVRYGTIRHFKK